MPATRPPSMPPLRAARGFTLIELMVALAVMALLAILSWRGLDGMTRTQAIMQQRTDEVLSVQAGLGQWQADLDAMQSIAQTRPLDWDGRIMRITRRPVATTDPGPVVVAWTRRNLNGRDMWLRWQSGPITTRGAWNEAWQRASAWGQSAADESARVQVAVMPLEDWQIFYYRGGAWTNPQSSEGTSASGSSGGLVDTSGIPDGVRVVLQLPPGQALAGRIVQDWVRPTVGGNKS